MGRQFPSSSSDLLQDLVFGCEEQLVQASKAGEL